MRYQNIFCAILIAVSLFASSALARKPSTLGIKAELEAMVDTDQAQRKTIELASAKLGNDSPKIKMLWAAQRRTDEANIRRLVEIVNLQGWPKISVFGEKASVAAFLVLQHADLAFQERFLPDFREAAAHGEAKKSELALLEDRVLMRNGKKQIYGSQVIPDPKTGRPHFYPIEDESNVDKRRAAMELEPIAEYAKYFNITYHPADGRFRPKAASPAHALF